MTGEQKEELQKLVDLAKSATQNIAVPDELAEAVMREAYDKRYAKAAVKNKDGNICLLTYDVDGWYFNCAQPVMLANP